MAPPSKLRAYVQWKESSVFAGEEIECLITFKNTLDTPQHHDDQAGRARPPLARQRTVTQSTHQLSNAPPSVAGSRAPSHGPSQTPSQPPSRGGHRPTLSLSVAPSPRPHGRTPSQTSQATTATRPIRAGPVKHSRSLSILSMGSDMQPAAPVTGRRPARGHGRSASVQVLSRTTSNQAVSASYRQSPLLYDMPPPITRRTSGIRTAPGTPAFSFPPPLPPSRTPSAPFAPATARHPPASFPPPTFSFPADPPAPSPKATQSPERSRIPEFQFPPKSPGSPPKTMYPPSPRPPDASTNHANPVARILSESSANATPRSSDDFYSLTNHSSETMASDIAPPPSGRLLPKPNNARSQQPQDYGPEILMMGYAQTMGSFVLDGSLVNQAPFDEVKRKGVVGGQGGGGVVGVERSKRESGIFGSFGWGNIGESLGGLLNGGEMSSIKEMRGIASSKTIPLLSTPQSILFVDLRLAPGESKTYSYRFRLPRGLPPTHKGRAIKVQYHLTIGVQRPGKLRDQQVKHVEIPFRVLGSVNDHGETLGHDLMSPYILLSDRARTSSINPPAGSIADFPPRTSTSAVKSSVPAIDDFLSYADQLLSQPTSGSGALLSPTAKAPRRRSSTEDVPPGNMKEAIDLAILRSNLSSSTSDQPAQSRNRFTIARAGQPVAVVTIVRPAYRLGETISGVIDFTPPDPDPSMEQVPTYNVNVWLETTERVDPSLAMRSTSSVQRATRKSYGHVSENVLFAQKTSFRLEIPVGATPTFETTGVQMAWRIRIEFTTARARIKPTRGLGINEAEDELEDPLSPGNAGGEDEMLEEVGRDERGVVLVARERLIAETFEVAVPIRVYGVAGSGSDAQTGEDEKDGLEI